MILRTSTRSNDQVADLIWVARARGGDHDFKRAITNVMVEEDRIYASDGHVLHIYHGSLKELKPGLYAVARLNKTLIELYLYDGKPEKYPDISKVVPRYDVTKGFVYGCKSSIELSMPSGYYSSLYDDYAKILRATADYTNADGEPRPITYNLDLLAKSMSGMTKVWLPKKGLDPLSFTGKNRFAVVMPMRMAE